MNRLAVFFVCLFALTQPLAAQDIGTPSAVVLSGTTTTLTLDFSDRDYELVLYSLKTNESDTARTFNFSLTGAFAASKPIALPTSATSAPSDRDRLESQLRIKEKALAQHIRETGGYYPSATKVTQQQVGSTRTFVFNSFGNVTTDQTVTATLVATSDRAIAYVDAALPDTIMLTTEQIQVQIDRFSNTTYPQVTSVFGDPSDVDNDGVVLFLYTSLVDEVGGVAGFYSASSVLPQNQGGNGNLSDLMYINPTTDAEGYAALLAHEFQHLISFNQHVLMRNGEGEDSWLNEAMSHVCEDLVGQHVEGGNRELIERLLDAPNNYALTASASFSKGVRGAAYMFARSLIEELGSDAPSRLVQTDKIGIDNVETVSGQTFATLFDRHLSRLFLSGSGLNNTLNYSYPFLQEATTSGRSFPPPREFAVSPEGVSVTGNIKPLSAAYLRLMGNQNQSTITIQTDADGDFRAQLIPIPRDYQPRMALPANYFPSLTFDAPILGPFTPGQTIRISGSTTDATLKGFELAFRPVSGIGDTIEFSSRIRDGRFDRSIVFHPQHANDYTLLLFFDRGESDLPFGGRFTPFVVTNEMATVDLPTDFFPDITLDNIIPTALASGQAVRLSGTVNDPTATQLIFLFDPLGGGDTIKFSTDIKNGRFTDYLLPLSSQLGDYVLNVFMGQSGGSLPILEKFFPFTITQGSGDLSLPVDFFVGITLDAEFPGIISTGDNIRLSGTVSDPTISEILFRFNALDGSDTLRFSASVANGQFSSPLVFLPEQIGDYGLDIFMGQANQSLAFVDGFQPIVVQKGESAATVPVDFFSGLTFTSPLPVEYTAGQGISISGTASDPTVTQILFRFDPPDGGEPIRFFTDFSNGQFGRGIVFQPTQGGTYDLVIFAGVSGQSLSHIGTFSSITVNATGNEQVVLPIDFFSGITFDSPLNATVFVGQEIRLVGQLKDPNVTQLAVRFDNDATGESLPTTRADVTNGRFDHTVTFDANQTGTYTLIFFAGQVGQSLPFLDSYSPISVQPSQPGIVLAQSTLSWGEHSVGDAQTLSVTLRNIGSANLLLSNLSTEPPFSVASTTATIAPGDSTALTITFTPTAAGTFSGTLQMATNDPNNANIQIALSGSAIAPVLPEFALSATTLDWGDLIVGQSDTQMLTLINPGTADLTLVLSTQNKLFALSDEALTIAPGDSTTLTITLSLTTTGSITDIFTITTNVPDQPQVQITLSATGIETTQNPDNNTPSPDFDGDGQVGFTDFLVFAGAFGSRSGDASFSAKLDLDSDGQVGFSDFLIFANSFGKPVGG